MSKRPSFQFYPADWIKDPALRRCTKAEKGVWIDILCLMHECEDYGILCTAGVPWSDQEIAGAIGGEISENLSCISELLRKGVAHRNQSGAIFCKRMTRDEHKRKLCSEAGKKGGNPNLSMKVEQNTPTLKGHPKGELKGAPKPELTPSSSTSTTKLKKKDITTVISKKENLVPPDWIPIQDWNDFLEHRINLKIPMTANAQVRAFAQLRKLKDAGENVADVINQSILRGWKGLFPVQENFSQGKKYGNQRQTNAGTLFKSCERSLEGTIYDSGYNPDEDPFKPKAH